MSQSDLRQETHVKVFVCDNAACGVVANAYPQPTGQCPFCWNGKLNGRYVSMLPKAAPPKLTTERLVKALKLAREVATRTAPTYRGGDGAVVRGPCIVVDPLEFADRLIAYLEQPGPL